MKRPKKEDIKEIKSLIAIHNVHALNELEMNTDEHQFKILKNLFSILNLCERYSYDFNKIIMKEDIITRVKEYMNFGCHITLLKFRCVFDEDAEEIFSSLNKTKTEKMRAIMKKNPKLCDTASLSFFERKFSDKDVALEKYNEYHKNKSYETRNEYWLQRGFSIEESMKKIKERQTTFSLEKCVKKFGVIVGRKKWEERQKKWRNSLAVKNLQKPC